MMWRTCRGLLEKVHTPLRKKRDHGSLFYGCRAMPIPRKLKENESKTYVAHDWRGVNKSSRLERGKQVISIGEGCGSPHNGVVRKYT
jgi:hypothetical protein